jgi:hypothetical protein
MSDLLADAVPLRRPRHNPRAVKRKPSDSPLKPPRPAHTKTAPAWTPPSIRVLCRYLTGIAASTQQLASGPTLLAKTTVLVAAPAGAAESVILVLVLGRRIVR